MPQPEQDTPDPICPEPVAAKLEFVARMRLPTSPMLAKPGPLPTGPGWSYEVKCGRRFTSPRATR